MLAVPLLLLLHFFAHLTVCSVRKFWFIYGPSFTFYTTLASNYTPLFQLLFQFQFQQQQHQPFQLNQNSFAPQQPSAAAFWGNGKKKKVKLKYFPSDFNRSRESWKSCELVYVCRCLSSLFAPWVFTYLVAEDNVSTLLLLFYFSAHAAVTLGIVVTVAHFQELGHLHNRAAIDPSVHGLNICVGCEIPGRGRAFNGISLRALWQLSFEF